MVIARSLMILSRILNNLRQSMFFTKYTSTIICGLNTIYQSVTYLPFSRVITKIFSWQAAVLLITDSTLIRRWNVFPINKLLWPIKSLMLNFIHVCFQIWLMRFIVSSNQISIRALVWVFKILVIIGFLRLSHWN